MNIKLPKEFFKPFLNYFKSSNKEIIKKDLDYNSGLEVRLQNPDTLLNNKGTDLSLYTTMMLDDTISSTIELKKRILLSIPYSITPASDNPDDIEKADFIQENLDNLTIPFNDQLDNFLDAWVYGFKIAEKVWEVKNGKWMWKNFKHKYSQYFNFEYDDYGNLDNLLIGYYYGFDTKVHGEKNINHKFIININPYPIDGNWYGKSDLMEIYLQYFQKYNTYRWRGSYLQGYGTPVPIVAYDKNAVSTTEYDAFTDMLDNWQDNMYVMIPSVRDPKTGELKKKFEVEFKEMASSKGGGTPYDLTIDQLDTAIKRKLLVPDKMGFTKSDGGSYALGETQFDLLKMIIRDGHTKLEELLNPHIKELIDLNYPNVKEYPKFKFNELSEKLEVGMLKLLLDSKIINKNESWLRGRLQLPQLTDKEKAEIEKEDEDDFNKNLERQKKNADIQSAMANPKDKITKDNPKLNIKAKFKTKKQKSDIIKKIYEDNEEWFLNDYTKIFTDMSDSLISLVHKKKLIENKDIKGIDKLSVKKTKLKELLTAYYFKLYTDGKISAIDDIKSKVINIETEMKDRVTIPDEWLNRYNVKQALEKEGILGVLTPQDTAYLKQLQGQAFFITGDIEQRMVKNIYTAIKNGIDAGESLATITKSIEINLTDELKKYKNTIARTNASDAFNTGRLNFFESKQVNKFIEAYQFCSIIDDVTTDFCRTHNDQIIKANDPLVSIINPPAHFSCRSILLPIMKGESTIKESEYYNYEKKTDVWGTNVPAKSRLPAKGFGGV